MSTDGQRTKCCRHIRLILLFYVFLCTVHCLFLCAAHCAYSINNNIAENYNRLSRVHERYRQTVSRQTDGRQHIASSRSLKIDFGRGSVPDLAGGAHDAPPHSLVGWGGEYPLPNLYPLDALGVVILGASSVQIFHVGKVATLPNAIPNAVHTRAATRASLTDYSHVNHLGCHLDIPFRDGEFVVRKGI